MKRQVCTRILLAAALCTGFSATGFTQQLTFAQDVSWRSQERTGVRAPETMLDVVINIDLQRVPLETALREIRRLSGVQLMYGRTTLPLDRRVTVSGTGMTLKSVLERVLQGSNAEAQVTEEGYILIAPLAKKDKAAAQGTIVGKVVNGKTKQPIAGANVTLGDASQGVQTGEDGTFRISAPVGEHTLHVRALGFTRQSRKVMVASDQIVSVEYVLESAASVLDEVVVTGTIVATERKAIPNPITVITAADIEKRGITRIEQFFRGEVPGVIALDKGSASYSAETMGWLGDQDIGAMVRSEMYVRGASQLNSGKGNPLKTYVDGIEILDPAYIGTIDPQSIERIEIITGPQAATVYGSGAMGGVMQIFTKKGHGSDRSELTLNLKYGMLENSLGTGRTPKHQHALNASGGAQPVFSYAGSLSYGYTGQWQPGLLATQYGASAGVTHTRNTVTVNGSVSTTFTKNGAYDGAWQAGNPWYQSMIERGEIVEQGCCARLRTGRTATSNNQTISVVIDYRATSFLTNNITVGRSQNAFNAMDDEPALWFPHDTMFKVTTSAGQRTTAGYNVNLLPPKIGFAGVTLALGLNGSWGEQTTTTGCLPTRTSSGYTSCQGGGMINLKVTRSLNTHTAGGFARTQVSLFDQLFLTFGLRGERNPDYGRAHKTDWTPSNGVAYTVGWRDVTVKVLGSYGRATRPPRPEMRDLIMVTSPSYTPSQYIQQLESPHLTPEYSRGPQGGIELYYGGLASLVVNHYQQKVTDLIQAVPAGDSVFLEYAPGSGFWNRPQQYLNTATIRQRGWETTGSLNVWHLSLRGTYSWNDTRILWVNPQVGASYYNGRGIFGIPTHTGNLMVSYAHAATNITLTTNFLGKYDKMMTDGPITVRAGQGRIKTYNERANSFNLISMQPAYAKSNLAVSHRLSRWASATVNVENLTDSYTGDSSFWNATLGRQTLLGLSLRYPK